MGQLELDLMKKQYVEQQRTNALLEQLLARGQTLEKEVIADAAPTATVTNIQRGRPRGKRVVRE